MQTQLEERQAERARARPLPRGHLIIGIVLLTGLAVLVVVVARNWPFTEQAVVQSLQQQAGSKVNISSFRQTYFPHPGCVAEGIAFWHQASHKQAGAQPFITIQKLTIVGSYHGLLTRHVEDVRAAGFRLIIDKQPFSGSLGQTSSGLSIGQLIADGAEVVFPAGTQGQAPLVFRIPKLALHDVADHQPLKFHATVQLPKPVAEVDVAGQFGPWQSGQTGQTRLSGSYNVHRLDLGSLSSGIAGRLTASGKFDGQLQDVNVQGALDLPDFETRQSKHSEHLVAEYVATVDGLNGDVGINGVRVHFRDTTIVGAGSVRSIGNDQGKTVTAELSSKQARIEDLLWMFVSENPPAMSGPILFRANAELPPGRQEFTKKIKLDGDFGISNAQYPNPQTQKTVDVLSADARGHADKVQQIGDQVGKNAYDPGKVLSNVKGHVTLGDGIAHLSNVSFDVPGAWAQVTGTYSLPTERINLAGHMHMEAELSQTTTGVKSFLLKIVQPFMKKSKYKESAVAIKIGGTYDHPTYVAVPKAEK